MNLRPEAPKQKGGLRLKPVVFPSEDTVTPPEQKDVTGDQTEEKEDRFVLFPQLLLRIRESGAAAGLSKDFINSKDD